jgi:nicotinamidase-related amidase
MDPYTHPDMGHSALITIDTQNDFTLAHAPAHIPGTAEVIPRMCRLLQAYRKRAWPVVHVVRLYLPDGSNVDACRRHGVEQGGHMLTPGAEGAELVEALKPQSSARLDADTLLKGEFQPLADNEYAMYKPRWGAFYDTSLESFLRQRDINTLVFCGCNFPNCPRTSIYEASERDFRLVLVTDALSQLYARGEQEMADIGVELMTTRKLEQVIA